MLFKRQKADWLLVALILVGLVLYASYQPRLRLRVDMPPEFVDEAAVTKNAIEEKIARAYWKSLVDDIQWRYDFGRSLPAEPPAEFGLDRQGKDSAKEDTATRMRYWHRAQHLWYLRSSWTKQYEWNFDWTTDWFRSGVEGLRGAFRHLGG